MPKSTLDSRSAIFIVGMPRSGTTLVEQIIASHPLVHGAGELMSLNVTVLDVHGPPGARVIQQDAQGAVSCRRFEGCEVCNTWARV